LPSRNRCSAFIAKGEAFSKKAHASRYPFLRTEIYESLEFRSSPFARDNPVSYRLLRVMLFLAFLFHNTTLQMKISKGVYNGLASLERKVFHDFTPFYTSPEAPI